MKLNILFLICIFAIFTIAYSKKVDKAVFLATKHHTDDKDERVNEDKGTPSCKRKLAKLQTEQKKYQKTNVPRIPVMSTMQKILIPRTPIWIS